MSIENEDWAETPIPGRNDIENNDEDGDFLDKHEKDLLDEFSDVEDDEEEIEVDIEEEDVEDKEDDAEEDEEDADEADDDSDEADSNDEDDDVQENSDEQDSPEKADEKKAYGKRAQKRIQKLAQQKNEYKRELEQMKKEKRDALEAQVDAQKVATEAKKTHLDEQLKTYDTQLKEAMDLNDSEKFVDLQTKKNEAAMQRMSLETVKFEEVPTEEEYLKQNPTEDNSNDVPEEAQKWVDANKDKLKNPVNRETAFAVSQQLETEGYDETSSDYYEELDKRLGETLVAFQKKPTQKKPGVKPKATKKQTMSGNAGTPVRKKGKGLVSLTASEKQIARDLGVSEKAYAKQKARLENSDSSYSEIKVL